MVVMAQNQRTCLNASQPWYVRKILDYKNETDALATAQIIQEEKCFIHLVGPPIHRTTCVDPTVKVIRVVLPPIPGQDISETGSEDLILPTFDGST